MIFLLEGMLGRSFDFQASESAAPTSMITPILKQSRTGSVDHEIQPPFQVSSAVSTPLSDGAPSTFSWVKQQQQQHDEPNSYHHEPNSSTNAIFVSPT